jgi:hypothetical protein
MTERHVPSQLWDYSLVYIAEILSIIARGKNGRPGIDAVMGHTIDISEWLDFKFYDYVWYRDERKADMAKDQQLLGRWLGILHCVGSDMTYWILAKSGTVLALLTVQHVTSSDLSKEGTKELLREFDAAILERFADKHFVPMEPGVFYLQDIDAPDDGYDDPNIPTDIEYGDMIQEN